MNIGLFEDSGWRELLPLTWLRAAFELRCGRDRLIDRIPALHGRPVARVWVRKSIREVVAERRDIGEPAAGQPWVLFNARVLLTTTAIPSADGVVWRRQGTIVAARLADEDVAAIPPDLFLDEAALQTWCGNYRVEPAPPEIHLIDHPWDLITHNESELRRQCRDGGVNEGRVHAGAHLLNPGAIFIGAGATIKPGVVLDAEDGPIHIDAGAVIQPNAVLEGPCCIGERTIIRPTAVIRPNTTIGRICKIGGEIEATIIHSYSNKQHDGFLGHSYVSQWVNLGAGTITSDLKNTYGSIRASVSGVGVETGLHFLGSIIGDHSKSGIGTILPTGCVIGIASNVFTRDVVQKFVPSFAWLTESGMTRYRLDKAIDIARIVMARRDIEFTPAELRVFEEAARQAQEVEAAGWVASP